MSNYMFLGMLNSFLPLSTLLLIYIARIQPIILNFLSMVGSLSDLCLVAWLCVAASLSIAIAANAWGVRV